MTEIITKAVVGKSKVDGSEKFAFIPCVKAETILGCWIINHQLSSKLDLENKKIILDESFSINIWYAYDDNSKTTVLERKIELQEELDFYLNENIISNELYTIINCYREPSVINARISEKGKLQICISKGIEVEVIGEVKIKIEEEV